MGMLTRWALGRDGQVTGLWSVLDWGGRMLFRCVLDDTHDCAAASQVRACVQVCPPYNSDAVRDCSNTGMSMFAAWEVCS